MKKLRKWLLMLGMLLLMAGLPMQAMARTAAKAYSLKNVTKAPALEGEWVKKGSKVRYRLSDGTYLKNRWLNVDGKIYYLNSKGYRVKGWVDYRSRTYYINSDGTLRTKSWLNNKYYLNTNGTMRTNSWLYNKYYLQSDGTRASGWKKIDGKLYYFNPETGRKKTGWVRIGDDRYYFNAETGINKRNVWVKTNGFVYFVDKDGKQVRSCLKTIKGKTYYFRASGVRATGTVFIDGKGYFFKENGVYDPNAKIIDPNKPMIALTFDDGPGAYTNRLLDCLERYDAKATFFLVGQNVPRYASTVKRMAKMGCEIGNHSYNHPAFTSISASSRAYQVSATNNNIKAACGQYPTVMRLPYGDGASSSSVLSSLGLPSIYWSVDTRDWANTGNPQHTINATLNYAGSGSIVLMHDIHYSSVVAAETIIPALVNRGYQLVTVSELAKYKGKTTLKAGTTYYSFR